MNNISIKQTVQGAIKQFEFNINNKFLQQNLIALEELKSKNNKSYSELICTADNAKITALGIIKLSNKGLIFGKDFNIIPFKNKLTTVIDSKVYQKRLEEYGWFCKKAVIFQNEEFEWDSDKQKPKIHKIDFNIDTSKLENIIGAYAFAINNKGQEKGILIRKADIKRWKESSPSGNSDFSSWNKWPKEMVEAKLYRKLAQELAVDISDIDLDEQSINENGDFNYIPYKDIKNENQAAIDTIDDLQTLEQKIDQLELE